MDPDAVRIGSDTVRCRTRHAENVSRHVRTMLRSRRPDYLALREAAADRRERRGDDDALRLLSSLVELEPGDPATARDLAYTAMELGHPIAACHLFRRVAESRPAEPESWRCLAEALEAAGRTDLALVYYDVAVGGAFSDAQHRDSARAIAAFGYARLLTRIVNGEVPSSLEGWATRRLAAIRNRVPTPGSLVVLLCWNTDRTDVDLHVTDPRAEECFYSHRETAIGGRLSQDVTRGYGPEMFTLREPVAGAYRVEANYFASDASRASLRTRLFVTIYEHLGTPAERVTRRALTLVKAKDRLEIGEVTVARAE
jgi:hypothetical protein